MKVKNGGKMFSKILSLLRTLYFNFRYLPLSTAIHLPIIVRWDSNITIKNSSIEVLGENKHFSIRLGYGAWEGCPRKSRSNIVLVDSKLIFNGVCTFFDGLNLYIKNGEVSIGCNVWVNMNASFISYKKITIGSEVLMGYDVSFRDSDGHRINGNIKTKEIIIADRVWIAAKVDVLPGVNLRAGTVVGYRSLITSSINEKHEKHSLIVGAPAKMIKENVNWSRD